MYLTSRFVTLTSRFVTLTSRFVTLTSRFVTPCPCAVQRILAFDYLLLESRLNTYNICALGASHFLISTALRTKTMVENFVYAHEDLSA